MHPTRLIAATLLLSGIAVAVPGGAQAAPAGLTSSGTLMSALSSGL